VNRLTLLLAVAGAHSAYYLAPEGAQARGWIAYVGTHVLAIVALALLLPWAAAAKVEWLAVVGAVACWWGILESGQAVVCSLLMWGTLSQADLCEQAFGREVYMLAAALGIAWAIVNIARGRQKRGRHG
jgi:hypothetical protein